MQLGGDLLGEDPTVSSIANGVQNRPASTPMVRRVPTPTEPAVLVIEGHHQLRTVSTNRRSDVTTECHRVLDHAVAMVEEFDEIDADAPRSRDLFLFTARPAYRWVKTIDPRLTLGDQQICDGLARIDPDRDRGRCAVLQVVRMSNDGKNAIEIGGHLLQLFHDDLLPRYGRTVQPRTTPVSRVTGGHVSGADDGIRTRIISLEG